MKNTIPLYPPRLTTTERDSLPAPLLKLDALIYHVNLSQYERWDGTLWAPAFTGGGTLTPVAYIASPTVTNLRDALVSAGVMLAQATYTVSGQITGSVQAGVTVSLGAYSAVTDGSGNFTITGVPDGTYTLTPSILGHTFTPSTRSVVVSGGNVTAQNFTASAASGTIQPHASLVVGHNYEGNLSDITGNFPAGWTGTPLYANNWSAQGQALTGFNSGGRTYFINTALSSTFTGASKKFTIGMHLRTGASVAAAYNVFKGASGVDMNVQITATGQVLFGSIVGFGWIVSTDSGVIVPNTNYHVAITYDHSLGFAGVKIYIDGVSVTLSTTGTFGAINHSGSQYNIGETLPADYQLYSFSVYNQALDAANVTRIMNNQAPLP
jgi:hypothetical protein